jgi:DNA (cytosine-5)-methyltransferase 1
MGRSMVRIGEDSWVLQGKRNRRLSWKECRILQCLPSSLDPDIDLIHKYKIVGNAVPPVFAQALLRPIVEYEESLL